MVFLLACFPVFAQSDADQDKRGLGLNVEGSKPTPPTPQATDKADPNKPELVIQTGHSLGVTAVTFSPDNKLLASGSVDNTIKLWDVAARQELRTLKGPITRIGAVAFSPNGKWLAAGGVDGAIQVWDVVTGREWRTFAGHKLKIMTLAFSPDNRLLASGSADTTVRVWDLASGNQIHTFTGHKGWVTTVAFAPDSQMLASGSKDNLLKLWSINNDRELQTFAGHTGEISAIAFDGAGQYLVSGGTDNSLYVWDVRKQRKVQTLSGHKDRIVAVVFSPDSRLLMSASAGQKTIKYWDLASGKETLSLSDPENIDAIASAAFSSDRQWLAFTTGDKNISIRRVTSSKEERPLLSRASGVSATAFSPDGKWFAVGGKDSTVKNSSGVTFPSVKVRLTGTNLTTKDYVTNTTGGYTSDPLNILGDYTFTPQGFTASGTTYNSFNPTNKSFASILTCSSVPGASCSNFDYLGIDFTAIPIVKANQTITFNAPSDKTFGDAPFSVSATASSGLPVSFSVVSGPASISANTITITGVGVVTVRASQAGDANFNAATPVDRSFTVAKANQTITFNAPANKTFGDAAFNVNASSSSAPAISFGIVSGPASILGNTITITGVGVVTVRASQAGDANFNAATPVDRTFTVAKANQTVTFNPLANKILGEAPFNITASSSSGLPISFSIVSGPATISGNTISITGVGMVTVRAAQAGDANCNAATSVDRSFTVEAGTFQPVVLTTDQVELKTWTFQGRSYAYVKLLFPNAGYRVVNWGQPVRSVNDFSADAAVEKFTGASVQVVTTTAQIYDLGPLAAGNYTFAFKNSGTVVKSLIFAVSSATPPPNPIDDARQFVKQQYRDFLNREADPAGENFWTDNITKCSDPARRPAGQTEAQCTLRQRETTSGAFFRSPEFQYTGDYVLRMYKGALGRQPKLSEFTPDAQFVGAGIIVNSQLSAAKINQNKADFAAQFVNCTDATKYRCAEFKAIYDGLDNQQYVDKLFQTTGVTASASDRTALVNALNGGTETRASVLQKVVDGIVVISEGNQQFTTTYGQAFYNSESNRAFVQLEYFGYMKRDPDDAGYTFWLGKLNQFNGNFVAAEMVLAFISSPEYRARFGQP